MTAFPQRLENMLKPLATLFRILVERVERVKLKLFLQWLPAHSPRLDLRSLRKNCTFIRLEGTPCVGDSFEDGKVLTKGEIDGRDVRLACPWV